MAASGGKHRPRGGGSCTGGLDKVDKLYLSCDIEFVIASFQHKGLKQLYNGKPKGIEASLRERCRQILALLDRAASSQALSLPGLNLHELKGSRKGTWSVSVGGNWRVTFRFENGNARDVNLEDYH